MFLSLSLVVGSQLTLIEEDKQETSTLMQLYCVWVLDETETLNLPCHMKMRKIKLGPKSVLRKKKSLILNLDLRL